ncbi:MAG: peptide deformylase [bacterium]|nr:peptide deformylase [bacterium]
MGVRIFGDRVLKQRAEPVIEFDDSLRELTEAMKETMLESDGIGLAAPQVGVLKRLFIMGVPHNMKEREGAREWYVVINPVFLEKSDTDVVMEEGCLSFPGLYFEVGRPDAVSIKYQDEYGNEKTLDAEGVLARVIQHEYDHLDGTLFIDRISAFKRSLLRNKLKKLQEENQ